MYRCEDRYALNRNDAKQKRKFFRFKAKKGFFRIVSYSAKTRIFHAKRNDKIRQIWSEKMVLKEIVSWDFNTLFFNDSHSKIFVLSLFLPFSRSFFLSLSVSLSLSLLSPALCHHSLFICVSRLFGSLSLSPLTLSPLLSPPLSRWAVKQNENIDAKWYEKTQKIFTNWSNTKIVRNGSCFASRNEIMKQIKMRNGRTLAM
jgi:hypothetical protein